MKICVIFIGAILVGSWIVPHLHEVLAVLVVAVECWQTMGEHISSWWEDD